MSFPPYESYRDSGVEWLGEVPASWALRRFRFVFKESGEKIEREVIGPMLSVSGYRGIEVKEYDDENRRRLDEDLIGYRVVRPGQLVVNTMWLNHAGLGVSEHEGHVSPAYRSYWIDPAIDGRFAHHLLRSFIYVKGYTRLLTGIRPNSLQMSREDLMDFPVLLPPLNEQKAIAAFLDRETAKIDAPVEAQRRLIELLKEKRQAVISHAVTEGLDLSVPMKESGVEWVSHVPAHWDVAPLKRFWAVADCKHVTPTFVDEGLPLASIREVQSRYVDLSAAKQTTQAFYRQMIEGGRRPMPGDLIFSRNATVGEVAEVADWHPPFAMGQDVCLLRKLNPETSTSFLRAALRSRLVTEQLADIMVGATFKRVNVEDIGNLMIAFPPAEEQVRIAKEIEDLDTQQAALIGESERAGILLGERRAALISAAVTGKIDVRNSQPEARAA